VRLKSLFWSSRVGVLAVVLSLGVGAWCVRGQSIPSEIPGLGDLKVLSYESTGSAISINAPSYQDLSTTIRLARAYAQGMQVLPQYHEPILTRGALGIAVFRSVSPSVVLVVIGDVKNDNFEPSGLGAGVILNSSGDILTNWHVVNGYSGALVFLKPDGSAEIQDKNAYGARVITQDEVTDLALLRLVKPPSNLHPVQIGSISSVEVAEDIHVIGHPNGNLWSYTTGVVSQLRNDYDWKYSDGSKHEAKVLQLQTAINPGNSGGPVVNDQGKLLGLVAMSEEGQNIDYAIASDVIQQFLSQAVSLKTRGGNPEPKSPDAEFSTARRTDGTKVLRVLYSDLIEYLVLDGKGNALSLRAETTDGTQIAAWKPNSFGGFGEWMISFRGGVSVRGRGNATVPDVFASN
jgi:S1-C subfamily serine protease